MGKLRSLDDVEGVLDDGLRSLSAVGMPGNVGTLGPSSSRLSGPGWLVHGGG